MRIDALPANERSTSWNRRFRAREWFSRSLLVLPGLYILAALALAEAVPQLEGSSDSLGLQLDVDTARTILSSVAGGMIAFTGLVVSIAVVVVQFGASQYTPRLVDRFRRDPVVKHSLGIFIAPAIYALVCLRTIGRDGSAVVPSVTVTVSILLLIGAVLAFFLLVGRLLDLLRPRHVIAQLVQQAWTAINEVYPRMMGEDPPPETLPQGGETTLVPRKGRPGVLSALDRARIVRAAIEAGATVEVRTGIGAYVPPGAAMFRVTGTFTDGLAAELRRSAIVTQERTITQDPAFAIRAIVDLALRALSPAVNDPTTAVHAIDGLATLLFDLSERDLDRATVSDEQGTVRLVYPTPDWTDLLDLSLTEIRRYGADSPQIPRRLRALLLGLRDHAPAIRRAAIEDQLSRLDRAIALAWADPVERAHAEIADPVGIGAPQRAA